MIEEINKKYLKEKQYKSTKYLEARIKIHKFTINNQSFHEWIFDQFDKNIFNKEIKILDVACGTGIFWKKNKNKLSNNNFILTMTDFAEAMIDKAKENLKDIYKNVTYEIAELEDLSKYNNKYDLVLCHNAVYHAANKENVIKQLKNCLNDEEDSFLSITTNSEKHMLKVYEIGKNLDKNFPTDRIIDTFTEEIADRILPNFLKIKKFVEDEKLKVNDLDILIDYVASGVEPRNIKLKDSFYDDYRSTAKKEIDKKGYFEIIKRSPLYICKK